MSADLFRGIHPSKLAVALLSLACIVGPAEVRAQTTTPVNGILAIPVDDGPAFDAGEADATIKGNVRSPGGELQAAFHQAVQSGNLPRGLGLAPISLKGSGSGGGDLLNFQVNDPALDHIVTFDPAVVVTRPFEFSTQSETSLVARGRHVVVGYNSSAGAEVQFFPGFGLAFTRLQFSGFSTSHDGGRTWTSGFVPAVSPDAPFTFGDPSLALDRHANVFYASLGTDAQGVHGTLIINKSTDHGDTWSAATVVAVDDGSDKEWLAIGPDPKVGARDNIYVTWTSFKANAQGRATGSELWLARSIDGGVTFETKQLFAPVDDGANSAFIQFSNPVVDVTSGRLYIPFLHISNSDADNVRVLVSDDGGVTFRFLAFNAPGALDAFAFPNVTPGLLNDCRGGGIRNALVQGADTGLGRAGFARFQQATRLISQPSAGAANGRFAFALNTNGSPFFGDNSQGSSIRVVLSRDGGNTWSSATIAAPTAADPQHVHPALSMSENGASGQVGFYVQQANGQLRVDSAGLNFGGNGPRLSSIGPLSTKSFDLTPSNVTRTPTATTNYDRTVVSCYDIGEYMSLKGDQAGNTLAAWGDNRNTWTSPAGSPAAGTHQQPDVFAGLVGN